jgi:signal transduction histidine kinase
LDTKSKNIEAKRQIRYCAAFKVIAVIVFFIAINLKMFAYFYASIYYDYDSPFGKASFDTVHKYALWNPRIFTYHIYNNAFVDTWRTAIFSSLWLVNIIAIILFLAATAYLLYAAGSTARRMQIKTMWIDKIPADAQVLVALIINRLAYKILVDYTAVNFGNLYLQLSKIYAVVFIIAAFNIFIAAGLARQFKSKKLWRKTCLYRFIKVVRMPAYSFLYALMVAIPIIIAIIGFLLWFSGGMIYGGDEGLGISLMYFSIIIIAILTGILLWHFASLSAVVKGIRRVANGEKDYHIETKHLTRLAKLMAADIEKLQTWLWTAIDDAVRGERLKSELITNVSHDLRTPLTSIISYVDLLKKEPSGSENAEKYITVLDVKSQQLKRLTDDLIEASKAASGSIKVNAQPIDLNALIKQALGEYDERIAAAGLTAVEDFCEAPVTVLADGNLMWRIVSNLMSNAVKYSAKGSRIYIITAVSGENGTIEIKNISAEPLNIPVERLLERFVRGEASRTTGGSGLGLSIAKSLAELQNGRLEISIDGDCFKARVDMPKGE